MTVNEKVRLGGCLKMKQFAGMNIDFILLTKNTNDFAAVKVFLCDNKVSLLHPGSKKKTKVIKNNPNPVWNEVRCLQQPTFCTFSPSLGTFH